MILLSRWGGQRLGGGGDSSFWSRGSMVGSDRLNVPAIDNSIAFGKSTSQRIYPKQCTHKIG